MTKPEINKDSNQELRKRLKLILHNDQHNTYHYVASCLSDICEFDPVQAEQLTLLAHYTGKAVIREGHSSYLTVLKEEFILRGLAVTLE